MLGDEIIERHNRGVALMGRFEYSNAHDVFDQMVREHPTWTDVRIDLAIATLNRQQPGDSDRAAAILDEVLRDRPNELRAAYCRAILYANAGHTNEALSLFQSVAKEDPNDAYAAFYVGQCLFELGDFEQALDQFIHASEIDSYLRSTYYGAFQATQRLGRLDDAKKYLDQFQKLQDNPQARLAEIKYTRMGPKAEVLAAGRQSDRRNDMLEGPLFAAAAPLRISGLEGIRWRSFDSGAVQPSITACDIDGDGRLDLFLTAAIDRQDNVGNAVLLYRDHGFQIKHDHVLSGVTDVNAALWGDYDNDGLTDVYFCRRGKNQLWRQTEPNHWRNTSDETQTAGGQGDTVDGAMIDADHDGDLDLLLINADSPNELFSNNLDGTFRPLADEYGIAGDGRSSRGLALADLDADRDTDLVIINDEAPHEVYMNDRLWSYRKADGFDEFCQSGIHGAMFADSDCDGQAELYSVSIDGIRCWTPDSAGRWIPQLLPITFHGEHSSTHTPLAVLDVNGDAQLDILCSTGRDWSAATLGPEPTARFRSNTGEILRWAVAVLDDRTGPSVIGLRSGQPPLIWLPGDGRYPFATVSFTGKAEKADQMRSNASGIGVKFAVRLGVRYTALDTFRNLSGPGQSLQPLAVGLGTSTSIDFISINWPDGVFQTEMDLTVAGRHRIEETQRQLSSCPVVFTWNGQAYHFISDVLGPGGIGYNVARGQYDEPRPWENLLLPDQAIAPAGGSFQIKLAEPMEEICYLDAARLSAYDLPQGWRMTIDERFAVSGPAPTGNPVFYRTELTPGRVINDRGDDVTEELRTSDLVPAAPRKRDRRFIGRTEEHSITLFFDKPLDRTSGQPVLVFSGWVEYPYSQTMFAAWQASAQFSPPTIEARTTGGRWHIVMEQFGYMAGMPRDASVPLPIDRLPPSTTQLRLTTNMEIYWDRVAVAIQEPCSTAVCRSIPLTMAICQETGFAERATLAHRVPYYEYGRRKPFWDARHPTGYYTAFGPITPLVAQTDDAVAIIGPGEELHMEFAADIPEPLPGWSRRFVLQTNGWCKDMDLFTRDGGKVGPLPRRGTSDDPTTIERDRLHGRYNTRYR